MRPGPALPQAAETSFEQAAAPGFWQRYTGVISGDGATITGGWEYSADGREWGHDFTLAYIAVAAP